MVIYCCKKLYELLEDNETPFEYSPRLREYYIVDKPEAYLKKNEVCMAYTIFYCPECGVKFPPSLADMWFDIIENQYGFKLSISNKSLLKKLPKEFQTDEWWKKRGL